MSTIQVTLLTEIAKGAFDQTLKIANGVAPEARLTQLRDGKGHPLWLLGHLANTLDVVLVQWTLGGEPTLERAHSRLFAPDFAKGAPITPNAADYPSWDEVVQLYQTMARKAVSAISRLLDEELPLGPKGKMPDAFKEVFPTVGSTIIRMTQHDAHHRGQIALLSNLG